MPEHPLPRPGSEAAARGLGARAREWVLGHRTWAANARRYDALYRRLGVTAPSA